MEELSEFAGKFSSENNIKNYDINIEGAVAKGENYLGEVVFFNITPKDSSKPFHFIRKKSKCPKDTKEKAAIRIASQREFYVYQTVFPEMKDFLKRHKTNSTMNILPEVYWVQEEENQRMMILENMKYSGYRMLDKKLQMNHEKVTLVLETYAKFHSISFAMKELEPEKFKRLTSSMDDVWCHFKSVFDAENYFGPLLRDVLKKLRENGRTDLALKYKPIEDDVENVVYIDVDPEDRMVVCHGDSWNNNMLFKNDEEGNPQSVCLIDFQISSLSTPVLDLCQFLLSAGDKEVLNNVEDYLKLYHQFLSDTLKNYEIDVSNLFSLEKLMNQWKKYANTGLVIAISTIQVSLSEGEEMPEDMNLLTYTDSSEMKNCDLFDRRVLDLLISFGEKYL
ncbi:uncharacterized protein LOC123314725 [Coccinella septempunctata]|uniref:uncharacterized protein LOC123314725 n=1 Tax=Coccinella septempunctata TaxID=41139 RepID=UPI001D074D87|nr:uncharacterized protein LOC123314725 [Coccinella septempunctata]